MKNLPTIRDSLSAEFIDSFNGDYTLYTEPEYFNTYIGLDKNLGTGHYLIVSAKHHTIFRARHQPIVGADSQTNWILDNYDHLKDSTRNETYDNMYMDNQANNIIDFTEINPFGKI